MVFNDNARTESRLGDIGLVTTDPRAPAALPGSPGS
jgi:hypothetical protein